MKTLDAFVIDSDGWSHADLVEACRVILRTVEVGAKWCQTDIPADCEDWRPLLSPPQRSCGKSLPELVGLKGAMTMRRPE